MVHSFLKRTPSPLHCHAESLLKGEYQHGYPHQRQRGHRAVRRADVGHQPVARRRHPGARKSGTGHIDRLLGARHGVRGIVNEDFIALKDVPDDLLDRIAMTPAAALGSTRDKPDQAYCERIFACFKKNDVRYFFYIGGNDSADTARIVGEMAKADKHDLTVFHIPKTIDNDLRVHDHTPGYGSAAQVRRGGDDRATTTTTGACPGIKVDVIMGRHAGFLTAASVLARQHRSDGPHLIYVPEAPLSEEKFLATSTASTRSTAAA